MKRFFFINIFFVSLLILFFVNYKWKTLIHLELTGTTQFEKIDLRILIDNKLIIDDTLRYNYVFTNKVEARLTTGYHSILVSSNMANLEQEETLFILPNQHIIINYYGITENKHVPSFWLNTGFNPFIHE